MTIITILLGLVGLGIVVLFHEFGHFLAARLLGVEVEEFSIGWGPGLASKRMGRTKYTVSVFPVGGYCRMKGENSYRKALEEGLDEFPGEPGSYFAASPLRRILISLAGPAMNLVFAVIVYSVVMGIGYTIQTYDNRILLASTYDGGSYPADNAGLRDGDRILEMDGKQIGSFASLQETVALLANRNVVLKVERNGEPLVLQIQPKLDRDSGAGVLGVYPWVEPVVAAVDRAGPAALAGLEPGDRLVGVSGMPVRHSMDLYKALESSRLEKTSISYDRNGVIMETSLILGWKDGQMPDVGIGWKTTAINLAASGPLDALTQGVKETVRTVSGTYRGLVTLFQGVNIFKAVSGPARITWMVGQVAVEGMQEGTGSGLTAALSFLGILSVGLFVMNLLPIPLLDGGSIILFVIEIIRGKAVKVKTVMKYQSVGMMAVAVIFIVATVGDIMFFSGR